MVKLGTIISQIITAQNALSRITICRRTENVSSDETENVETDQLFNQDYDEEDEFEIPAFLRKQKF